ncbi:DUF4430 domain-containing protein [Bacillus sp. FJAT-27245]|uniref:DUF4430 domain-containing protein n=1 Tax=Bacillus sp. FJAT-27245 TaxID=1684144 RepID=UPI0006A7C925|nr:DUF4430 domain-containing protein [Bacillus sp. FJAT-27245]
MGRKIIIRLLLAFSLLAALALGGCGTAPEPSETKQKQDKPETVLQTEDKDSGKTSSASQQADTATTQGNEVNTQTPKENTSASSVPGTTGEASSATGTSTGKGNGDVAGSGKAGSANNAGSSSTAPSGSTASKNSSSSSSSASTPGSAASSGNTSSTGSTSSSGSTASTGGTGSSGTSSSSQPSAKPVQKPAPAATVTISIKGPDDTGIILGATAVEIKEGDTVLDVLLKAAGKKGIDIDYTGSGPTAYVAGIDNFYELDYGSRSGWVSKKNGKNLEKGAGVTKVSKGDRIEWVYTEDFLKKE